MIRQLKLGIKLLPFAYGIKICLVGALVMSVFGVVVGLVFPEEKIYILFIAMTPLWFAQTLNSLGVSKLVQSSPMKKEIQTGIVPLFGFVSSVLSYLLNTVLVGIGWKLHPEMTAGDVAASFLYGGIFSFILQGYVALCYKYFVVTSIAFFVFMEGTVLSTMFVREWYLEALMEFPIPAAILLGFVPVCLGGLFSYGVTKLAYKKQLSKLAQYARLRNQM